MPSNEATPKEILLEQLFRQERTGLLRYVTVLLRKHGTGHTSVADSAEDVVQEIFYLAWEKSDALLESESPVGWLYHAAKYKVQESLRDERNWVKQLTLSATVSPKGHPSKIPAEWAGWMTPAEYELMRKLYLEGYTYKELCDSMGIKRTALAMRIHRLKERLQKNLKNF